MGTDTAVWQMWSETTAQKKSTVPKFVRAIHHAEITSAIGLWWVTKELYFMGLYQNWLYRKISVTMYNRRVKVEIAPVAGNKRKGENRWNVKLLTNAAEQKGGRWKRTRPEIELERRDGEDTNWNAFRIKVLGDVSLLLCLNEIHGLDG